MQRGHKIKSALLTNLWVFLATGFGVGNVGYMPGTAGTLLAVVVAFYLRKYTNLELYGIGVFFIHIVGVWICDKAGKILGEVDHAAIVWDEIAAFFLIAAFIPTNVSIFLAAFVVFRVLDIMKPFPICWIESRVAGGFGVMLDDFLAAIITIGLVRFGMLYLF